MQIGNVKISGKAFLAPMAGITDLPFRSICKGYGAAMVYSEMISAKGLHYNDKKTAELMRLTDGERPAAIQLFGSDPLIIAEAVRKTEETARPEIIDLNMGCPAPKIVNNGDGSALLKDLKLAGKIIKAAAETSGVPITVKIRSGWDSINAVETAKMAEANGAAAIAVHPRTRGMFYSGRADWDIIRAVKDSVNIPVIGNGDIFKAEDAKNMLDYTGCDAVMVARGAQGNPFIFRQINELLNDGKVSFYPSAEDRINQAIEHIKALCEAYGEKRGICEGRKHIAWYIKGLKNSATFKNEVFKLADLSSVKEILKRYLEENGG